MECPTGATTPTLTGLTPTKVNGVPPNDSYSQGFGNVEGLVWIGDSLYMSHISGEANPPKSRILKLTGSNVSVFADGVGTNGLAVDATGNLVGATHKDGCDPTLPARQSHQRHGHRGDVHGQALRLAQQSHDSFQRSIYFTDPNYQAPSPFPQDKTRVYRITPAGVVSVVDENLSQPNGVTLSLDEKTLYVASGAGLFKYAVNTDGSTGASSSVAPAVNGDGMAMDCAGDLYVASGTNVVVFAGDQEKGRIAVSGVQSVTNVAFGGADHKTLYISGLGSNPGLFQVPMTVAGMPY